MLGKSVLVEDENFTGPMIDVAPEVIIPVGYSGRPAYRDRASFGLDVIARMKPGVTIEQAQAQLDPMWLVLLDREPSFSAM